ncbi:hypothetical protein LCGC14_1157070 [marine sediment metagenome]|uniref:Uncharacterized protein n=1 Tax=marine sediment metagenome TaxID=412755 RepID=A0A0F9PZ92_9ZZZZ
MYCRLLFYLFLFLAIEIAVVTWLLSGIEKHFVREYEVAGKHYLVYERVR